MATKAELKKMGFNLEDEKPKVDRARLIRKRSDEAKRFKDVENKWKDNYKYALKLYNGESYNDSATGKRVNYTFTNALIKNALLANQGPRIIVKPSDEETALMGMSMDRRRVLENLTKSMDLMYYIYEGVRDAIVGSFGAWLVYWEPKEETIEINGQTGKVDKGRLVIEAIDPETFYFDPLTKDVERRKWDIRIFKKTVQDIIDSPLYNKGKAEIKENFKGSDLTEIEVDVIEHYDYREGVLEVVLDGAGVRNFNTVIRRQEIPDFPQFFLYIPYRSRKKPYGLFESAMTSDIQIELDNLHEWTAQIISRMVPKYIAKRGIGKKSIERLAKGGIAEVVDIDTDEDINKVVTALPVPTVPPEFWARDSQLINKYEESTGINAARKGGNPGGGTATEMTIRDEGASLRSFQAELELTRILNKIITEIDRLAKKKMKLPMLITLGGETIQYSFTEDNGNYDIVIEPGSSSASFIQEEILKYRTMLDYAMQLPDVFPGLPSLFARLFDAMGIMDAERFMIKGEEWAKMAEMIRLKKVQEGQLINAMDNTAKASKSKSDKGVRPQVTAMSGASAAPRKEAMGG